MRSDILLVALVAVVAARPVPIPEDVRANIPRELQYSDLVAMTGPPDMHHWSRSNHEQEVRSPSDSEGHHRQAHGRKVGF